MSNHTVVTKKSISTVASGQVVLDVSKGKGKATFGVVVPLLSEGTISLLSQGEVGKAWFAREVDRMRGSIVSAMYGKLLTTRLSEAGYTPAVLATLAATLKKDSKNVAAVASMVAIEAIKDTLLACHVDDSQLGHDAVVEVMQADLTSNALTKEVITGWFNDVMRGALLDALAAKYGDMPQNKLDAIEADWLEKYLQIAGRSEIAANIKEQLIKGLELLAGDEESGNDPVTIRITEKLLGEKVVKKQEMLGAL